jgi:hypothetical protein
LSLHSSKASHGIDLLHPLFTYTNANQAATYTRNTQPRVSPNHVVNHSSQPGATIHRSSDAPVLKEVDPDHIAEVKIIMGVKLEDSPYAHLDEVYTIGADHVEGSSLPTPYISCTINGEKICKALCDIRAHVSVMSSKLYYELFSKNFKSFSNAKKIDHER